MVRIQCSKRVLQNKALQAESVFMSMAHSLTEALNLVGSCRRDGSLILRHSCRRSVPTVVHPAR